MSEGTMEPGRELDALVAEHVMEWVHVRTSTQGYGECWELPDGTRLCTGSEIMPGLIGFAPSTDIAAAWEVVEKLVPPMWVTFDSPDPYSDKWIVWLSRVYSAEDPVVETERAEADTPAHAICLAALKAVGYKA